MATITSHHCDGHVATRQLGEHPRCPRAQPLPGTHHSSPGSSPRTEDGPNRPLPVGLPATAQSRSPRGARTNTWALPTESTVPGEGRAHHVRHEADATKLQRRSNSRNTVGQGWKRESGREGLPASNVLAGETGCSGPQRVSAELWAGHSGRREGAAGETGRQVRATAVVPGRQCHEREPLCLQGQHQRAEQISHLGTFNQR